MEAKALIKNLSPFVLYQIVYSYSCCCNAKSLTHERNCSRFVFTNISINSHAAITQAITKSSRIGDIFLPSSRRVYNLSFHFQVIITLKLGEFSKRESNFPIVFFSYLSIYPHNIKQDLEKSFKS